MGSGCFLHKRRVRVLPGKALPKRKIICCLHEFIQKEPPTPPIVNAPIPYLSRTANLKIVGSISSAQIELRLTPDRLSSYMDVMGGNLQQALDLYKLNEVVLRNEIDNNLQTWAPSLGADWMNITPLDEKGRADIAKARSRNARNPSHGKVLDALNFGFWRFLVANRYLHTIWIPTMNSAFPNLEGHPGSRREMIERHIAWITSLLDWICLAISLWATEQRRVQDILLRRPSS